MTHALTWFEIPVRDLPATQRFYEAVLGKPLQRESMGGATHAVFPYERGTGVGGSLMAAEHAPKSTSEGVRVYLDAGEAVAPALERAAASGGQVVMPRTALPPGMGFIALIADPEGNVVGLHAPA